jgi:hypothetical protein
MPFIDRGFANDRLSLSIALVSCSRNACVGAVSLSLAIMATDMFKINISKKNFFIRTYFFKKIQQKYQ